MSTQSSSASFVNGFVAGSVVAAAFLYFFTSRRGREHTKRFLDATEDIEEGIADIFDELLDRHAAPNKPKDPPQTPTSRLLATGSKLVHRAKKTLQATEGA